MALLFLLGMALFFGFHLLPFFPEYRQRLIDTFDSDTIDGKNVYRAVFVVASIVGLFFIAIGKGSVSSMVLWNAPMVLRVISLVTVFVAFVLIASAYLPHSFKHVIAHPMLIGVILWAATHLIVNGDPGSILLFGCFIGYSIFAIKRSKPRMADDSVAVANNEDDEDDEDDEDELAARKKKILIENATVFGVAVVAFGLTLWLHEALFGKAVLSG